MMELWHRILSFNDRYFTDWRQAHPVFFSNAMAGELGEICNITKRMAGGGTHRKPAKAEDILEESVDLLIYSVLLLQSLGFTATHFKVAFDMKMKELEERMAGTTKEIHLK